MSVKGQPTPLSGLVGSRIGHYPFLTSRFRTGVTNGFPAAMAAGGAPAVVAVDTLILEPFVTLRTMTPAAYCFRHTTNGGAGSVARIGIYEADQNTLLPTTLLFDSGSVATDAGAPATHQQACPVTLVANRLYWFVYVCGVAAPTVTTASSAIPLLGVNVATSFFASAFLIPFPYAALPAVAPNTDVAGFANLNTGFPVLWIIPASVV